MHFNRLLGAALAALFFLGVQNAEAASSPLTQKRGTITTQNLVPTGACTTGGCVESEITTAGSVTVQVTGTYTASGGLTAQATTDGVNWVTLCSSTCSTTFTRATTGATSAAIASGVEDIFQVPATGYKRMRITALGAVTGTATITIQPTELVPSGFASISGGAGDASAANQSTQITAEQAIQAGVGAVADAAATQGSTGSVSAKLRTVTSQLNTGNTSLASIDTKTPALGTQAIASSRSVTPATSSTWAATQSGTWSTRLQDGSGNAVTSATRGSERALTVQLVDGSGTQITSFGGSGGTASNFGSATPATGTAAGMSDGTNMQSPRVFDVDSGAGTQYVQGVNLRVSASGGSAEAAAGSGATSASTLRVVHATDDPVITAINSTNTQLPAALGQTTMSASLPVTLASNQSNVPANIAQINGVTPLMGAGNTGTGSPRVTVATDQAALATWGHGATGAAVPANVTAMGARAGANSVNVAQGSATVAINVSTATTTQLVALSGSTLIRVTGLAVVAGGTGNITFVYGTGTNCGTGTTSLSGAIPLIANAGLTLGGGLGAVMVVPAGQALCVTTSAAVQMSGFVTYTQF